MKEISANISLWKNAVATTELVTV